MAKGGFAILRLNMMNMELPLFQAISGFPFGPKAAEQQLETEGWQIRGALNGAENTAAVVEGVNYKQHVTTSTTF